MTFWMINESNQWEWSTRESSLQFHCPTNQKKIKWNRCFQLRFQLDLLLLLLHLLLIIIYYSHYYSGIELQQREEINGQKQDMHTWWTCVMDFQIFWCRRTWIAKDGTGRIDRTFRLTRTSAIETTSNGIWLVNGFNLVWLCNLVLLYIQSINKSIRINTEWSFFWSINDYKSVDCILVWRHSFNLIIDIQHTKVQKSFPSLSRSFSIRIWSPDSCQLVQRISFVN